MQAVGQSTGAHREPRLSSALKNALGRPCGRSRGPDSGALAGQRETERLTL